MGLLDGLKAASAAANDPNAESAAAFAPAWRWENVGDGVEGVVVSIDTRVHDNHPEGYPIVTVRQEDGTPIAIHGLVTVLKNEINERGLHNGDIFAVIYDGKKTSGGGRQFHAFRVAHQPSADTSDSSAMITVPAAPAAPAAAPVAAVSDPWAQVASSATDVPPF